ncbi:MAG: hypothetical protein H6Q52_2066 [Deltaproteobacteria bacterium]|nr:hypothetical protein [Deltaproteobacteria bacterium]
MKENNMMLSRLLSVAIIVGLFISTHYAGAQQKPEVPEPAIDAIGEFLRGINILSGGTRALPSGDPILERVRTRYEIPERTPILSPHGGSSVVAFIFDSEKLPVTKGPWKEISPNDYKYLQTYHNLKAVYCLHEEEPVDLGDIVIAVKPGHPGTMFVYFNDKNGTIDSARICTGNSVLFPNSKYIVKPVGAEF